MRRLLGCVFAVVLLLAPASRAQAQFTISFGSPAYGLGYTGVGYGYPAYGYPGAYGVYSGGYGVNGFLPGASYYSSGYSSFYAAPGTSSFVSGSFAPYIGSAPLGGYGVGYPGVYGFGYAPRYGINSRWVSTGMFMGLPRPGGGLVQVPY